MSHKLLAISYVYRCGTVADSHGVPVIPALTILTDYQKRRVQSSPKFE